LRLTGFDAIEFAEKHNLRLKKHGDAVNGASQGRTIAEAEAIAVEDEGLIYLDIPDEQYQKAAPTSFEPDR
jgi:hypothetical protein